MIKRLADIKERFEQANAERAMYNQDSKFYNQLTEIISFILSEYGGNNQCKRTRHSFRMGADGYHLVTLDD